MSASARAFGKGFVVAIDGPAGSGKSSTAREVARQLGLRHLDSGALYRTVALGLLQRGILDPGASEPSNQVLSELSIGVEPAESGFRVLLAGKDPGEAIREEGVTGAAAQVAKFPAVRRHLLVFQRSAAEFGGIVADGRDMGTVVFPDAELKVFLTASLDERARRRLLQDGRTGGEEAVSAEAKRIGDRDRSDQTREAAPLREASDALRLDTTELSFEEQVARIVKAARDVGVPLHRGTDLDGLERGREGKG
jgi:cytidylate kinase